MSSNAFDPTTGMPKVWDGVWEESDGDGGTMSSFFCDGQIVGCSFQRRRRRRQVAVPAPAPAPPPGNSDGADGWTCESDGDGGIMMRGPKKPARRLTRRQRRSSDGANGNVDDANGNVDGANGILDGAGVQ